MVMSSNTLSEQTCIETIGIGISKSIEDNASNIIGILVLLILAIIVAVVLSHPYRFRDRSNNTTEDSSSISSSNNVDDIISNNVGGEASDDSEEISVNKKRYNTSNEQNVDVTANTDSKLHDEALFKQPPPKEDCPLCYLRLPTLAPGSVYMSCCGKLVCNGCYYAPVYDNQGNKVDNRKCSFCRTPWHASNDEFIERTQNRMEAGDAEAMFNLGCYYQNGTRDLSQDYTKALELYHRAAELGHIGAYTNIGYAYNTGMGVEVDKEKAVHYYELAAMRGNETARYNLGFIEHQRGNMNRALKHYLIAARSGYADSLKNIQRLYKSGQATKEEYTKALRLYQAYLDEIKSNQRDQAVAANDKYRYY